MESSSENSFTWTDTSNDSDKSSSITTGDKVSDLINSPELESKLARKKKSKISSNTCNGTRVSHDSKLDIKMEQDQSYSEEKKKVVKIEPESDIDIPKKKKKHKYLEVGSEENDLQDSASYDESYLNLRVKQEMSVCATKQKRKHSSVEEPVSTELKYEDDSNNACGDITSQDFSNTTANSVKSNKKKKKSKKRADNESQDDVDMISEINNAEINEEKHQKSPIKSSRTEVTNSFFENDTFQDESGCEEISAIQCDGNDNNLHIISLNEENMNEKASKKKGSLYKSTIVSQFKIANSNLDHEVQLLQGTEKRTPRISDRIRFEDSDDSDTEPSHTQDSVMEDRSLKLRKFMKTNSNMKLVANKLQNSTTLTHNDEIWIVKCPKEIDIQAFSGTDLNVHGKCKLKIGGQSYDGSLEDEPGDTTTALSMVYNRFKIENLPLCGIINFRKRIPKAHVRDDNIMVNNQTNFIPLPETKCRHPLFGSNYKKALKIPASVAERLNANTSVDGPVTIEMKRKKKHKKAFEHQEHYYKEECGTKSEQNSASEKHVKKQKKRKHTDDEGPAPKRLKKIKCDTESAEAWESEKAIEQNLFDF